MIGKIRIKYHCTVYAVQKMSLYLDHESNPVGCPICLTDIEKNDMLVTPCQHHFHESCFSQYCKSQKKKVLSCPSCKTTHVGNITVQSSCPNKKKTRNKNADKQNKKNIKNHGKTLKNRDRGKSVSTPVKNSRSQSRSSPSRSSQLRTPSRSSQLRTPSKPRQSIKRTPLRSKNVNSRSTPVKQLSI